MAQPAERLPTALHPSPPTHTLELVEHTTQHKTQVRTQLGIELRQPRDTLLDAAASLLAHGYAAPAWYKGGGTAA